MTQAIINNHKRMRFENLLAWLTGRVDALEINTEMYPESVDYWADLYAIKMMNAKCRRCNNFDQAVIFLGKVLDRLGERISKGNADQKTKKLYNSYEKILIWITNN